VETTGVWAKEAISLLLEIGRCIAEVTGEKRSGNFLLQLLSNAVQRGTVASALGTLPPGKELEEIYLV